MTALHDHESHREHRQSGWFFWSKSDSNTSAQLRRLSRGGVSKVQLLSTLDTDLYLTQRKYPRFENIQNATGQHYLAMLRLALHRIKTATLQRFFVPESRSSAPGRKSAGFEGIQDKAGEQTGEHLAI